MTPNCKIDLNGSVGKPPKLVSKKGLEFLVLSIATRDTFQDEVSGKTKEKTLWHDVIAFHPDVIQGGKDLQKGEKVRVLGTLSYKSVDLANGYKTSHATIIATLLDHAE